MFHPSAGNLIGHTQSFGSFSSRDASHDVEHERSVTPPFSGHEHPGGLPLAFRSLRFAPARTSNLVTGASHAAAAWCAAASPSSSAASTSAPYLSNAATILASPGSLAPSAALR